VYLTQSLERLLVEMLPLKKKENDPQTADIEVKL